MRTSNVAAHVLTRALAHELHRHLLWHWLHVAGRHHLWDGVLHTMSTRRRHHRYLRYGGDHGLRTISLRQKAMFRRLVPRHQAKVAATTWTRKTAAATACQKRRRNASGRMNRSPRTNPKENPSRCTEPIGGTDAGWLAEEVENLPPVLSPRGTGDRQPSDPSRSSDAGNRRPEHRNVTPVLGMVPCVSGGWQEPLRGV